MSMYCLITNNICPNNNKKCKICKLDDCRKTFEVLEEAEKMYNKTEEEIFQKKIRREYIECYKCPFLKRIEKEKVYCFYRLNNRCILDK